MALLRDLGIILMFLMFYGGVNALNLGYAFVRGEVETKADVMRILHPGKTLYTYNEWITESYTKLKDADGPSKTDHKFGIFVASLGIFAAFLLIYSLLNLPFGDSLVDQVICISLSLLAFALIGGLNFFLIPFKTWFLGLGMVTKILITSGLSLILMSVIVASAYHTYKRFQTR